MSSNAAPIISFNGSRQIGTSGQQQTLLINPNVHQVGSAGHCALKINPTYTSVGTGKNYMFQGGINENFTVNIRENGELGLGVLIPTYQLDMSSDGARKLTTTTWLTGSDERVKDNIEDANIDMCYDTIKNLKLKRFKWSEKYYPNVDDRNSIGFIAQEVETVFPKAVKKNKQDFLISKGETQEDDVYETIEDFRSLDIDQLNKTMFGALQKAIQRIETLEQTVEQLQKNIFN